MRLDLSRFVDWDTWAYHWPLANRVLVGHTFSPKGHGLVDGYPLTWELLGGFLFTLTSSITWMSVPNMVAILLLCVGIFRIGTQLGSSNSSAFLTSVLAAWYWSWLIPGLRVDLAMSAALVWAVFFGMRRQHGPMILLLALACSTKTTGWPFALIVMLTFRPFPIPWKWAVPSAIAVSFWPIRNMIYFGRPFGVPVPFGYWATSLVMVDIRWNELLDMAVTGFGLSLPFVLLGAIGGYKIDRKVFTVALAIVAIYILLPSSASIQPFEPWNKWAFKTNLRFALPAWALFSALGSVLLTRIFRWVDLL